MRAAYILIVRRDVLLGGDAFFYHLGARLLVEGHGFIEPAPFINGVVEQSASHPPLYLLWRWHAEVKHAHAAEPVGVGSQA